MSFWKKALKGVAGGFLGSFLGPVGSAVGSSLFGGSGGGFNFGDLLGIGGQFSANRQNKELAREQMAFQERMSSTAYQRAAMDLEKAGLNRILALGSPASTPGGATAQMENVGKQLGDSQRANAMQKNQFALMKEQTKQAAATTRHIEAQASKTRTDERFTEAQISHEADKQRSTKQQIRLSEQQVRNLKGQLRQIDLQNKKIPIEMKKLLAEIKKTGASTELTRRQYNLLAPLESIKTDVDGIYKAYKQGWRDIADVAVDLWDGYQDFGRGVDSKAASLWEKASKQISDLASKLNFSTRSTR